MEEIWKDIKDYEGRYQVSNYGRVRSLNYMRTGEMRVMKQQYNDRTGYKHIILRHKNSRQKLYLIHRLVAMAFIPNPDGLPQVNHIDEDKTNNCVWNLEWCTAKYNTNYGSRNEQAAKTQTNRPDCSKRVYQYTKSGAFVQSYPSMKEAKRQTGIDRRSIRACCNNKPRYKSAGNYIWSFNPPTDITPRSLW